MFNLNVIYNYNEGLYLPTWLILRPEQGCFDWDTETTYVSLNQPFTRLTQEDINDDTFGLSIVSTDLIINTELPDHFGIYVPRVKQRINQLRGEVYTPNFKLVDIEQLVVQMSDLQTIVQNTRLDIFDYDWE